MFLSLIMVSLSFLFPNSLAQTSCVTTEQLMVTDPEVELKTIFYSTLRKESVRMALALSPMDETPVYNLLKCVEPSLFNIEEADVWEPESCQTLSPFWIPLFNENGESSDLTHQFVIEIEKQLRKNYVEGGLNTVADKTIDNLNALMSAGLGLGLQFYAKKYTPKTRLGKNTRRFFRLSGWALIASAAFSGLIDFTHPAIRDVRRQNLIEISELIEGIDREVYFQFDGTDSAIQRSHTMGVIFNSLREASHILYQQNCSTTIR